MPMLSRADALAGCIEGLDEEAELRTVVEKLTDIVASVSTLVFRK
jgi:hypothetical protein